MKKSIVLTWDGGVEDRGQSVTVEIDFKDLLSEKSEERADEIIRSFGEDLMSEFDADSFVTDADIAAIDAAAEKTAREMADEQRSVAG